MLSRVLFSIDNSHDVHSSAKFLRQMDTLRALGELTGAVTKCIGSFEGVLEDSYLMLQVDYDKFVRGKGYTEDQICIMYIPGDTRQPCTLEYGDGRAVGIGSMIKINKTMAQKVDSWTYTLEDGRYWCTKDQVDNL